MIPRLRIATVALAAIATLVSAYLTWVHYSGELALCVGVGGCETVQASRYAMVGPIPVALIGLAGSLALLAIAASRAAGEAPPWTLTGVFGLSVAGTLYVAYLTYLEVFVIGAICPWCATVALATVTTFALTLVELRAD